MNDSCITRADLYNYTCANKGLILPLISEYTWPLGVRAALYLIAMLWCFLGIAIAADVFMCAIEKITSFTRTVKIASPDPETIGFEEVEVKVRATFCVTYTQGCATRVDRDREARGLFLSLKIKNKS